MPPEITRLTQQFLKDPTRIEASRPAMTADTIAQYLVRIPSSDPKAKRTALRALVGRDDVKNGIVFCNRKSEVDIVAKSLKTHGFDAAPIHGDLDQSLRMKTLADFRSGALKILVASDVAARGLDIPDVSHVFNYDVSHHADDYVHRIGRTGRAGKKGQAFMIVTPADDKSLDKVLKLIKMDPEELTLDINWSGVSTGGSARGGRKASQRTEQAEQGERPQRSRGGRRSRSESPAETEAAPVEVAAAEPVAAAPADQAEKPRRTRSRRGSKAETAPVAEPVPVAAREAPAPDRQAEAPAPRLTQAERKSGARKPKTDDAPAKGSGFGNDVPAFLLRRAPISS